MSTGLHPEINEAPSDTTWLAYLLQIPSLGIVTLHPGAIPGAWAWKDNSQSVKWTNIYGSSLVLDCYLRYLHLLVYHVIFRKRTQGGSINGFQLRKILLPRDYVALLRDIFKCHNLGRMSINSIWGCSKLAIYVGQLRLQSIIVRHCLLAGTCQAICL